MNSKTEQPKKKKNKNIFKYFVYDFVKWTGALPVILWYRLKIYYESPLAKTKQKKGVLISANHIGYQDPIILTRAFWRRRLNMVATKDLFTTKLKKWFFNNILCIEIDKENISIASYKEIVNRLKDDKVVTIFPEGHIVHNKENQVDAFKSGVVLMAMQANVPIVPVHIIKKEKWWHRQKIIIGEPVVLPSNKMNLEEIQNYCEILRKKEIELFENYKKGKNK